MEHNKNNSGMGEARAAEMKWEYICAWRTKLVVSCRAVASLLG